MSSNRKQLTLSSLAATLVLGTGLIASPARARMPIELLDVQGGGSASLPSYLQCVPYARLISGIQLFGDAHTWWKQAEGQYARGFTPKAGAVMAFKPHGAMTLGHVAAVSRVIDKRHILLRHSNWSPINGKRGQIEDNVMAVDVSEANDWSEVRVWFDPIQGLGSTRWPVQGFIYNKKTAPGREHGLARSGWKADPIGAIIAAFVEQ
jgi:surface antigen